VNPIAGYLGGGLTLGAPLAERPEDQVGLAVAAALNGSRYRDLQAASGVPARDEVAVEATYLAQLTPWFAAQADIQYVIHPGGLQSGRDALVLGLRLAMTADTP
jgi:porin